MLFSPTDGCAMNHAVSRRPTDGCAMNHAVSRQPTDGCAMNHAVSRRPLTVKARVQTLVGLCGIYGAQNSTVRQVFFRALHLYNVRTIPLLFT